MRNSALLMLALLAAPTECVAQTKQYFSYASICGTEAEFISLSDPNNYSRCANSTMTTQGCISALIYRYQLRCPNGQVYSGPEVYIHSKGGGGGTLRLEGNTLAAFLSHRQTQHGLQPVWDRLPAGATRPFRKKVASSPKR